MRDLRDNEWPLVGGSAIVIQERIEKGTYGLGLLLATSCIAVAIAGQVDGPVGERVG